jgi:hypothetical protein
MSTTQQPQRQPPQQQQQQQQEWFRCNVVKTADKHFGLKQQFLNHYKISFIIKII